MQHSATKARAKGALAGFVAASLAASLMIPSLAFAEPTSAEKQAEAQSALASLNAMQEKLEQTAIAYDEAVAKVFESLARLEQILGQHRYLTGNQLTEADIRLWTTLVRFDPVYVTHFKCDKHRISDYLNLYGFLRDIYQMPGIAETVNFDHIRNHYFRSHKTINPTGIISIGPWQDLDEPHGRDVRFG